MPFYRLKTGIVHMKGSRLPSPCAARVLIDGKQQVCLAPSGYLCDGPPQRQGASTCDQPMCEAHARQIGPNRHLCPACYLNHREADPQRGLFTSIV
ncbi:hypothetical protein [Ottowia sp. VDI28]|uniref:hypothetical protein n=1 Tax=Ottowia sp. VDI28 TaxID=3133968 RepID=UPI003C2FC211